MIKLDCQSLKICSEEIKHLLVLTQSSKLLKNRVLSIRILENFKQTREDVFNRMKEISALFSNSRNNVLVDVIVNSVLHISLVKCFN